MIPAVGREAFRTVFVFEIDDFEPRIPGDVRQRLLDDAYEAVRAALDAAQVPASELVFSERTGGAQIVLPADVEQTRLTESCLRTLGPRLANRNRDVGAAMRLRLRVALSAGSLNQNSRGGWYGAAVDEAAFLVAGAATRGVVARGNVLALAVSEPWFDSTVGRQSRGSLRSDSFSAASIDAGDRVLAARVAGVDAMGLPAGLGAIPSAGPGAAAKQGASAGGGSGQAPDPAPAAQQKADSGDGTKWLGLPVPIAVALITVLGGGLTAILTWALSSSGGSGDPPATQTASSAPAVSPSAAASTASTGGGPAPTPAASSTGGTGGGVSGKLFTEVTDNHRGTDVYTDDQGDVPAKGSAQIPFGTTVKVKCYAPNDSGMGSINDFYLVETAPWTGEYAPANTFLNADAPGTGELDPDVPAC